MDGNNCHHIKTGLCKNAILMVSLLITAGCTSGKVEPAPAVTQSLSLPSSSREPVDESWPTDAYVRLGVPDPRRYWTASDFRECRDVLFGLSLTNRTALPRLGSAKSGVLFARLTNPTNTVFLADARLASGERAREFMAILNRLPVFQDIYRMDSRQLEYARELIEIDHTFLRMLGSAVQWDGKQLPPSSGETEPVRFRLVEISRSYRDSLVNRNPGDSVTPRGERDRLILVAAHALATLNSSLPWLADGTGLAEADRIRGVRYLREDTPILRPHISADHQRE
jgi:hypothetical protein